MDISAFCTEHNETTKSRHQDHDKNRSRDIQMVQVERRKEVSGKRESTQRECRLAVLETGIRLDHVEELLPQFIRRLIGGQLQKVHARAGGGVTTGVGDKLDCVRWIEKLRQQKHIRWVKQKYIS